MTNRIVFYKDFDVYVTNAMDITIRIVLNRRDVSGQDRRMHTIQWKWFVQKNKLSDKLVRRLELHSAFCA